MKKKLCAILLALCLPLTLLTGCGSNGAADGFLDTLKEAENQENYQLELISAQDEKGESGKKLSGTISKSNGQADLTLTVFEKGDQALGTLRILVDGKDVYLQLDDWIDYLTKQYKVMAAEIESYNEDIKTLAQAKKKLNGQYVKITLGTDAFSLEQESASEAFHKWYNGLGKELKDAVTEEEGEYTLSLQDEALGKFQISWLTQLVENQEAYCDLMTLLLEGVGDTLAIAGWSSADYLDSKWTGYEEELSELEKGGVSSGSSLEARVRKQEDGAYALSIGEQGETVRFVKATVTPLKQAPEKWAAPEKWTEEHDVAEPLSDVYLSSKGMSEANNTTESGEDIPAEADWDKRYAEEGDDSKDYGTELELSDLKGYTYLKSMEMSTEDNKKITLPMVAKAEYSETDQADNGIPYSVYQSSNSWEGNVYDLELADRSLEEILKDSVDTYVETYKTQWNYKIIQGASKVSANKKGTAYAVGFAYQDPDRNCQVTWLSFITQVKGSQYAMVYEYSIYADNADGEIAGAMKELCQYFQVELPLTVKTA